MYLDCIKKQIIPPYIPYFRCEVNTGKLRDCLSLGACNLKTIKSSCYLEKDLNRAKVGHFSDMIFVSLAKLFNKNSKLLSLIAPDCMS